MRPNLLYNLAVTAAFVPASALVTLVLGLSPMAASSGITAEGLVDAGTAILAYAVVAGLIVDAIRLFAELLWHEKPKHRLRLGRILRQNLA